MPQYTDKGRDIPLIPQATYKDIHLCNFPHTDSLLTVGFEQEFFLPRDESDLPHTLFRSNSHTLENLFHTASQHGIELYSWHAERHEKQFEFSTHPKPAQQACLELILLRYLLEQLEVVDWYDQRSALHLHITHPNIDLCNYAGAFGTVSTAKDSEVRLLSNRIEIRYPRASVDPWSVIYTVEQQVENILRPRNVL